MMKHKRPSFPSDLVTMMEAAGSTVTIATKEDNVHTYTLLDFLSLPMENKLIVSMEIPFLNKDERLRTFKVMSRAQVSLQTNCNVWESHCTNIILPLHLC